MEAGEGARRSVSRALSSFSPLRFFFAVALFTPPRFPFAADLSRAAESESD